MYNEESGAEKCVRALCRALQDYPYRTVLVVINDGSVDATGEILRSLEPEFDKLTVVTHRVNAGYGGAIRTGIRKATELGFDYALFMDSDLTNDPKYIEHFIEKMLAGYDVIKASRYISGGQAVGVPAYRVFISTIGNGVSRLLFGLPITDCTNGFLAMKVTILKQMPLTERGFAVIMEELYYAKFLAGTFCEIPYILTARPDVVRKSSFHYRPKVFYRYLKYAAKSFLKIAPQHILILKEDPDATHDLSRL
jgi:glycosyltransferase involved in cell wall biosynthesis